MSIGVEFMRHPPCAELQLAVVRGIAQGSLKGLSERAWAEPPTLRELTGLARPQPIHDPARGVGDCRQSNRGCFDAHDSKGLRPQAGDD